MFAFIDTAIWALVGATSFGLAVAVTLSMRDRKRLTHRLTNLEDVLRRMRSSDPASQFDDRPDETPLQLSRERIGLTNLLDRFPEVTKEFVAVKTASRLGESILASFHRILGCECGVAFLREGDTLKLVAQTGMQSDECPPRMTVPMSEGRIGHVATRCLILRRADFATLDHDVHAKVEETRVFERDFEYYIPLVHDGTALGCVAIGGMRKVVQKAHTVSLALANLGALVLTNIRRAEEIRKLSQTDPLTQLSNRRHFYEQLDHRLRRRGEHPFALLLIDIDHFKQTNDSFGHHVGDEVLVRVADVVRAFVREDEGEFACRFGGEEFICVVAAGDLPSLSKRLDGFRASIGEVTVGDGELEKPISIKISGGVSFCPAEREEPDALIQLADARLYRAKEEGRDRIYLESAPAEVEKS
ncbi:MAG: GGDEF domain-containing protein [Planctomycetota bacterium]|jgi:diguanylate cyclase (GGDEF)-like protein